MLLFRPACSLQNGKGVGLLTWLAGQSTSLKKNMVNHVIGSRSNKQISFLVAVAAAVVLYIHTFVGCLMLTYVMSTFTCIGALDCYVNTPLECLLTRLFVSGNCAISSAVASATLLFGRSGGGDGSGSSVGLVESHLM
ncbi:hypothetical protein TcWFU_003830 [Taenia crassiceps]|uniref:Uncharacterized protein n=1 Tax=Taenia crassiceps TaxID=6207 RepID=A0ABR4Q1G7_9CEST